MQDIKRDISDYGPMEFVRFKQDAIGFDANIVDVLNSSELAMPIYFDEGVLFSLPQIWIANHCFSGPLMRIGRFRNGRCIMLNCITGQVGASETAIAVDNGELFTRIIRVPSFPEYLNDAMVKAILSRQCCPAEVFDLDFDSILLKHYHRKPVKNNVLQKYRIWMERSSLPGNVSKILFSLVSRCSVQVGSADFLSVSDVMDVNDSWELLQKGLLIIGFCPVDANAIVMDIRNGQGEIGYVALEEIVDEIDLSTLYTPVSASCAFFLHEACDLGVVPFDCRDARVINRYRERQVCQVVG